MFTLLPEHFKKDLMKEYRVRLAVVACFLSLVLLVFSIGLFSPSFFTAQAEHAAFAAREKTLLSSINQKTEDSVSKALDELRQDVDLIGAKNQTVSPVIRAIYGKTMNGITITNLEYTETEDHNFLSSINGVAASRSDLSRFAKELEKEEMFDKVDLPISNLAKDVNATFTISIVGKQQ